MLSVNIICVGKLSQKFYQQAQQEYSKRLSRFVKLKIIELQDLSIGEKCSEQDLLNIKKREGEKILSQIKNEYVIALEIGGKSFSSTAWADHFEALMVRGISTVSFVIGGSLGLCKTVSNRANETLSFSSFTFCHALARVVLLEQIFRAHKIIAGEAYHK